MCWPAAIRLFITLIPSNFSASPFKMTWSTCRMRRLSFVFCHTYSTSNLYNNSGEDTADAFKVSSVSKRGKYDCSLCIRKIHFCGGSRKNARIAKKKKKDKRKERHSGGFQNKVFSFSVNAWKIDYCQQTNRCVCHCIWWISILTWQSCHTANSPNKVSECIKLCSTLPKACNTQQHAMLFKNGLILSERNMKWFHQEDHLVSISSHPTVFTLKTPYFNIMYHHLGWKRITHTVHKDTDNILNWRQRLKNTHTHIHT